jgi:hypothetical protein
MDMLELDSFYILNPQLPVLKRDIDFVSASSEVASICPYFRRRGKGYFLTIFSFKGRIHCGK